MTEYIKEFVEPSNMHESLFVGYLWTTPSLYEKYRSHTIERSTFTNNIWFDYFYIGREMYNNGIRTFDDVSAYTFIASRPKEVNKKSYMELYNEHGGYQTIEELMNECGKEKNNDEYHFSEVQKYECLRKFQQENLINIEDKELVNKLCMMTLKQIQTYFQYKIGMIFSGVNSGEVVEYDLGDDLDLAIEKMNAGEAMGLPLHDSPRLSKKIKGWRKGELIYLVLSSGVGKSSIAMEKFIMTLYEHGEKGAMFTNEENVWKSRNLLLATVSSKIKHRPINREKLSEGNFDEKTLQKLKNAKEWIEEKGKKLVKFYDMKKYRVEDMLTRISLTKPIGVNYHLLDTFKPDTSAKEEARWEAFSNSAQDIFNCIKPEANNVGMLATVQLKIGKEYRYLDLSAIGKSLEIVEVASVVLMGRLLYGDEIQGKNKIFAYNWVQDAMNTGKWHKEEYILDPDKTYMVLFIAKNRMGSLEEQILYEVNYGINSFKEVALVKMERKSNTMY